LGFPGPQIPGKLENRGFIWVLRLPNGNFGVLRGVTGKTQKTCNGGVSGLGPGWVDFDLPGGRFSPNVENGTFNSAVNERFNRVFFRFGSIEDPLLGIGGKLRNRLYLAAGSQLSGPKNTFLSQNGRFGGGYQKPNKSLKKVALPRIRNPPLRTEKPVFSGFERFPTKSI